jgi:hypothetical protein
LPTLSPGLGGVSGDSLRSLLAHLPIEIYISRQKLSIIASRKEELKNGVISSTYCSGNGCLKDCSLPVEMMHSDSINDIYIETFSMIGKQMEI